MNTEPIALSKVDLHISDLLEPITTTLILNHQSGKWRLNNSLQHLSELFGDGNSLHDLLRSPSLYITSLNFAVCHPWRTLWNSNQMGTSSCTVFLFRFSLNTLYIRLVFIKTKNLPVVILGMNFVFSSLHTSWSRILCTWC